MKLLENKLALVTGAGGGLGSVIAQGFVNEGARVVLADLDLARAEAVAAAIREQGGQAWAEQLDVTDRAAVQAFAAELTASRGAIDILVNNAGISGRARMDDPQAEEVWDRLIQVNLQGLFNVTHAFVPALKQSRGCIVSLSSIVAFVSGISSAGYIASKGAVRSFTQALARDLAEVDGDLLILGVGGKMGPSLARMAKRAAPHKRVIGVARFSEPGLKEALQAHGVECLAADLS